jgi:hypothetical protein
MNRKIYILLTVLLAWSFGLKAQTAEIESLTATPGAPVSFDITVADFPSNVGAISMFIGYDADVLTFTGTTAGTISGYISNNMTGTEQVGIQWTNPGGQAINGTLLTLNFTYNVLGGECDLTFDAGTEFTENDLDPITVAYTYGHIGPNANLPTLTIEDKNTAAGPTTVNIDAAGFSTALGAITLYIKYDPSVATFTGTVAGTITGYYAWASNGVIGVSWTQPAGDPTINGTLLTLKFNYSGAGSTDLQFQSGCEIVEPDFDPVLVSFNSGSINPLTNLAQKMFLSDETALPGNPVSFDITASGYGSNVGAITLFISYEPSCLTFLNLSAGTISGANANLVSPGLLGVTWTNSTGQPINGLLLSLNFIYNIGSSVVAFAPGSEISDNALNIIPTSFFNGSMAQGTGGAIAEIPRKVGTVGQTVAFPVYVSDFPTNVGAISLFIGFNSSVLQYTGTTAGSITGYFANYMPASSQVGIQWSDFSGVEISPDPQEVLLYLNFTYLGGYCEVKFNLGCEFAENDLDPIDVEYYNGALIKGTKLDVKAFLEGPFNGTDMNTTLNDLDLLPLEQPYSVAPWSYAGTENVTVIPPNADIVDWVLLELRETTGAAASATSGTMIARKAVFILSDGSIVGLDGAQMVLYNLAVNDNLYAVIYHRNHLAIMSANALTYNFIGGFDVYSYNFTDGQSKAYNNGQKAFTGGYGMYAGDADGNGDINLSDLDVFVPEFGQPLGYYGSDFDLNGDVNLTDLDYYVPNFGTLTQVP